MRSSAPQHVAVLARFLFDAVDKDLEGGARAGAQRACVSQGVLLVPIGHSPGGLEQSLLMALKRKLTKPSLRRNEDGPVYGHGSCFERMKSAPHVSGKAPRAP